MMVAECKKHIDTDQLYEIKNLVKVLKSSWYALWLGIITIKINQMNTRADSLYSLNLLHSFIISYKFGRCTGYRFKY